MHYLLAKKNLIGPPPKKNPSLENEASSYVDGLYISTHLDAWCRLFHRLNNHALQISSCRKIRMTYKTEGTGLQADDIFQKGYTYQICICNDPAPKTY